MKTTWKYGGVEFKKRKLNRADIELVKEYCIYFCSTFYLHSRRNRAIETEFCIYSLCKISLFYFDAPL